MVKLIDEPRYICFFTCIAKDFEEERARLEIERTTVKQLVDVAANRGEIIQANALFWKKEADELIQEDTKTKQKCLFGFCPHIIWRYKRGKELTNKKEQIKRLIETGKQLSIELSARLERYSAFEALKLKMRLDGDSAFEIYDVLKLSYDDMENEKAKRLFLLCSVFQEDENIPIEMVTRLGIGAGLLGEDYGSYKDARSQVVISKNELLGSCLLMEDDQSRVKMHGFVRDAAQRIANKEIQTVKLDGKNQNEVVEREKNIKYLFCKGKLKDVLSYNLDGSKLEILIVTVYKDEDLRDVKFEVPNSFFENKNSLRVFHLLYDHYHMISLSLPQSIKSLKNIRSLLFTLVDLGDISTLANLQSLETLDLKDCKIDELPNGIAELKKFRLLNLECCIIERNNPFEVIERCSLLEELYFTGSFNASYREITFPKLQRFCIDEHWRSVNDSSSKHVSVLEKDEVFLSETALEYCMQEAEVLRLTRIEGEWRNIMPEIVPVDHGMNDLVELSLSCISQLQHLIDTNGIGIQVPNVFLSKLVVLKLDRMENLEELFNGPVSCESLKNLKEISIKDCKHLKILFKCKVNLTNLRIIKLQNCPMLVSVFQLLTSRSLVSLEKLQIANCEGLENIVAYEKREEESREEIHGDNDNESPGSMFSKLKVIAIEKCPRLQYIFPFLTAQSYPALEAIRIRRCDMLKYIIGQDHSKLQHLIDTNGIGIQVPNVFFSKLVVLKLDGMENLEELFNGPVSFESLMNLEKVSIKDCKHLNSLFKCQINLYNLKIIKLQNCPMLVSVFQPLTSRSLVSLEKLQIANCEGLENIVTYEKREEESRGEIFVDNDKKSRESMFSKLKVIAIEECPRLQYIFPFLSAQSHPAVEAVRIRRCDKLKYIIGQDHSELSYRLHIWEYVLCLPIQSYSMCNIKEINLSHFFAIKSLFILSITPRMLLETLTIEKCDELKNIIIDDNRGNNWGVVFPKLKSIYVKDCIQFEYIFGYYDGDYRNHNEIHLHLPALKDINLCNLPGLVAMCTKQYRPTFPPLVELKHNGCPDAAIKSFHDFKIHRLESLNSIKKEHGDGQLIMTSFSIATTETNDQGDPSQSQIDEDLSSSLVVTKKIENLVSKNHLAIENFSLLTDFLVKHPSILLRDTSLGSRYKGYAYNSLAELLKFLQKHSVLDMLGSSHSEFVELLQDVRRFPFDKEWLDGVEKVVGLKTHID